MFLEATRLKMRHLPTTGGGPGDHAGPRRPLAGDRRRAGGDLPLRPVGQAARDRELGRQAASASLPDVPTFKSQGIDIEAYLWVGLFTSAGVPDADPAQMRELIAKVAADPLFKQALENVQVVPDYRDAPEFRQFFDADYKRMAARDQGHRQALSSMR